MFDKVYHLSLQVKEKSSALSCRAVWPDDNTAELNIAKTRTELDKEVGKIEGVQFFISSITGTTTNKKNATSTRPGVAYFIVYRKNSKANESAIFKCLHDSGMEASVTEIKSRNKSLEEKKGIIQGLEQVVKVIFSIYFFLFL